MVLFNGILVPLASERDATRTAEQAVEWLQSGDGNTEVEVTLLHVIEKGGGSIDKAPLPAAQERAAEIFEIARDIFEDAGFTVATEIAYGTDPVETICSTAETLDVDGILFRPREYGPLERLLTKPVTERLVKHAPCPSIVLPARQEIDG